MPDKRTPRGTRGVRWSAVSLLVVSAVTAGCGITDGGAEQSGDTTAPTAADPPAAGGPDGAGELVAVNTGPDIHTIDLTRFQFRINCDGETVLAALGQETVAESDHALDGWATDYEDVTGDGVDDALVSVVCTSAGGEAVPSVVVVTSKPDGPAQVGDPIGGSAPSGVHGTLVVDVDDPTTGTVRTEPYRLVDEVWTAGSDGVRVQAGDLVTSDGIGPVQVGMTFDELAAATGSVVVRESIDMPGRPCLRVTLEGLGGFEAVSSDVGAEGRRAQVEALILTDPTIAGRSVTVGDSRDQVLAAHPDAVERDGALVLERPDGERVVVYSFEDGDGAVTDVVTDIRVGDIGAVSGGRCRAG